VGAAVVVVLTIALDAAGIDNDDPSCVVAEPEPTADPSPSTVVATTPAVAGTRLVRGDAANAPETARERGATNPATVAVDFEAPEKRSSLEDAAPGPDPDPATGPDPGKLDPSAVAVAVVPEMEGFVDRASAALPALALGVMDPRESPAPVAPAVAGGGSAT
jgi:hypothetical protein